MVLYNYPKSLAAMSVYSHSTSLCDTTLLGFFNTLCESDDTQISYLIKSFFNPQDKAALNVVALCGVNFL